MKQLELLGVEYDQASSRYGAIYEITDDDGSIYRHYHVFPAEAIEWRMAEYDATVEEAIDMVLYEPFVTTEADTDHPSFLYNATDKAEAKAWHLGRCREHKQRTQPKMPRAGSAKRAMTATLARNPASVLSGDDPYAALAGHVRPDQAVVEVMRAHVNQVRSQLSAERQNPPDRATLMRQRLGMQPISQPPVREVFRGDNHNQAGAAETGR